MNSVLWILQIFLAVVFAWHGWMYVTWPPSAEAMHEKLTSRQVARRFAQVTHLYRHL